MKVEKEETIHFKKYIYDINPYVRKNINQMYQNATMYEKNASGVQQNFNVIDFFKLELLKKKIIYKKQWYDTFIAVMLGDYYRLNDDVTDYELEKILTNIESDDKALNEIVCATILFLDLTLDEYNEKMKKKPSKLINNMNVFDKFEKANFDELEHIIYADALYIKNWIEFWSINKEMYVDFDEFKAVNNVEFLNHFLKSYEENFDVCESYMNSIIKINKLVLDYKKIDNEYKETIFDKKLEIFISNYDNELNYNKEILIDDLMILEYEEQFLYEMVNNYNMISYIKNFFDKNIVHKYQHIINENNNGNIKKKTRD